MGYSTHSYKETLEVAVAFFAIAALFATKRASGLKLAPAALAAGMELLKNSDVQSKIRDAFAGVSQVPGEIKDTQPEELFHVGSLALLEGQKIFAILRK